MESIIRKMVKEELAMASANSNVHQEQDTLSMASASSASRYPQIASRMNSLISKINGKSKSGKRKKPKPLTLQIKYMRDFYGEGTEVVSVKNGGGIRFCSFEDATFQDVLDKAVDVFFPNDINYFGEIRNETDFQILDCSESVIENPSELLVSDFLKERGMYPSKTFFYLKSSHNLSKSKSKKLESLLNQGRNCTLCKKIFYGDNCVICDDNNVKDIVNQQTQEECCSSNGDNQKQVLIGCPLCFNQFPLGIIEQHAATCRVENPIILSDDDDDNNSTISEIYNTNNDHSYASSSNSVSKKDAITILKDINAKHKSNGKLQIKVRRHKVFEDFRLAIAKPWNYNHEKELNVVFTGEPSVDDGGPRRELFSCM